MKKSNKKITAAKFDKKFDNGKNVVGHLDLKKSKVTKMVRRVNIGFPVSLLSKIDKEAKKIGVTRTTLIKIWLAERLERAQ